MGKLVAHDEAKNIRRSGKLGLGMRVFPLCIQICPEQVFCFVFWSPNTFSTKLILQMLIPVISEKSRLVKYHVI